MLNDAIELAQTEHIVYFLLTAYVETLDSYEFIPARAKQLPMAGKADVLDRLRILRNLRKAHAQNGSKEHAVIEETIDVFSTALQRLTALNFQNHVSTAVDIQRGYA